MKKAILTILILLILNSVLKGQVAFEKIYYTNNIEMAKSIVQTSDSGYIIAGQTEKSGLGNFDACLIKTNIFGDTIWTKTYGSLGYDCGNSVQQTKDGGYIITGQTDNGYPSYPKMFIIKTDSKGDTLWTKIYGEDKGYFVTCVQQTNDSGYILVGSTNVTIDTTKIFLMKINANGEKLWLKRFGDSESAFSGTVIQTTDNGFVVIGSIARTTHFPNNSYKTDFHIFLIKTNEAGNTAWIHEYGGDIPSFGNDVKQTKEGNYVLAGSTIPINKTELDFYLLKVDREGNPVWSNTYGGDGSEGAAVISQTYDGGYMLFGNSNDYGSGDSKILIVNTDSLGRQNWQKFYRVANNSYYFNSAQQTIDSGFVIAGYCSVGYTIPMIYLIKTGIDICPIPFSKIIGDTILCEDTQNVLVAGSINSAYSYLWSNNETSGKISISQGGVFSVGVTDDTGCMKSDTIKIKEVPLPSFYLGNDTIINAFESVILKVNSDYASYLWSNGSSLDTVIVNSSDFAAGDNNISLFVTDQYGCSFSDTIQITINPAIEFIASDFKNNVIIYPNPSEDIIFLKITGLTSESEISIIDENGKLLLKKDMKSDTEQIDISNYPKGLYFVIIKSVKFSKLMKILKY